MTTLILDGYHVIHAVPELARHLDRSLQSAREALVRLCRAYRARRGDIGRLYEVFNNARAFGAGVMSVQAFYQQARPVSPRHPRASPGKASLSARDAQQITEAYRKHLETRKRPR